MPRSLLCADIGLVCMILRPQFKQLVKDTRDRMAEAEGGAGTPPPRDAANESVDAPTAE